MFYCPVCEPDGNKVSAGPVPSPAWCAEHRPAAGDYPDCPALAGDAHYLGLSAQGTDAGRATGRRTRQMAAPEDAGRPYRAAITASTVSPTADVRPDRDRPPFAADPPQMVANGDSGGVWLKSRGV